MIAMRKGAFLICAVLIAGLLLCIFCGWLTNVQTALNLGQLLGLISPEHLAEDLSVLSGIGRAVLFLEYLVLGLLAAWMVAMLRQEPVEVFLTAASCSFTVACVSETLKMILPASSGSLTNVLLGAAGSAVGAALPVLFFRFCLKKNKRPAHRPRHVQRRRQMPKFKDMD